MTTLSRYRGCMLGLAIGDAYGAAYEFQHRDSIQMIDDYQYCEVHDIEAGFYTDDASQTLCLAASILECGTFDEHDFAQRLVRWFREGYMSSVDGTCFDIGHQTRMSLEYYESYGEFMDTDHVSMQGNGSLMRIGAIAMAFRGDELSIYAAESSRVTHAAQGCIDLCVQYAQLVRLALDGATREEIQQCANFHLDRSLEELRGTGYVVHAYQVALHSFFSTDSYFDCIRMAVSVGDDTDTNACIAGMLAGAYYGAESIDLHLIEGLADAELFISVTDQLYQFSQI